MLIPGKIKSEGYPQGGGYMTKLTKLELLLEEKGPKLYTTYLNNKGKFDGLLREATLPFYTTHGIEHSRSLIVNFDRLIPDDIKEGMNAVELFILLSSAYFHDIGMAVVIEDEDRRGFDFKKGRNADKKKNAQKYDDKKDRQDPYTKRLDFIRRTHSHRTHNFIMTEKNKSKFDLDDGIAYVLATICKAHSDNKYRKDDDYRDVKKEFKEKGGTEYTFQNLLKETPQKAVDKYNVRVHFLAALLRLGDELDISYKRADKELEERKDMPPHSVKEHRKNALIQGINIDSKKPEITVDVFVNKLYKGGKETTAENNQLLTEVIIKLRSALIEVKETLNENELNYKEVKFQDIEIQKLQNILKNSFSIENNSQKIYDDREYNGAMLYRFYYMLEKLNLSPEFIITNDIDFFFSDSGNLMENLESIFSKFEIPSSPKIDVDLKSLKFDILKFLNQLTLSLFTDAQMKEPEDISILYLDTIKEIEKEVECLDAYEKIIKTNIPKIITDWSKKEKIDDKYYIKEIKTEILANIIRDIYSYLRRKNYEKKSKNHYIYITFSETYFLNILKARKSGENAENMIVEKLKEIETFVKDKENPTTKEFSGIKLYYHTNSLDTESKLISSEVVYENSITNDSVLVINNTNVMIEYYDKYIEFLQNKDTWKIKSINPKKMTFEFDKEKDEYYKANEEYKDKFKEKAEKGLKNLVAKIEGVQNGK